MRRVRGYVGTESVGDDNVAFSAELRELVGNIGVTPQRIKVITNDGVIRTFSRRDSAVAINEQSDVFACNRTTLHVAMSILRKGRNLGAWVAAVRAMYANVQGLEPWSRNSDQQELRPRHGNVDIIDGYLKWQITAFIRTCEWQSN